MKKLEKVLSSFERWMLIVGILLGAVVLFVNVVLRNFGMGLEWAEELAKFAIMWITFGGCGAAVREKSHMNISALYDSVGPGMRKAMDVFINTVCFGFSTFLFVYGAKLVSKVFTTSQLSPTMQLPMWIIYISVPIGAALMMLRYGAQFFVIFSNKEEESK